MRILYSRVIGVFGIIMLLAAAVLVGIWKNYEWTELSEERENKKEYDKNCKGANNTERRLNDTEYDRYCQDLSPPDPLGGLAVVILGICGLALIMPGIAFTIFWLAMEHREKQQAMYRMPPQYQGPWPPPPPPHS